jgi:NAD(P)H-hydrate epimerase
VKKVNVLSSEEMKRMDQYTILNENIGSFELMKRAGERVFNYMSEHNLFVKGKKIVVVCGIGNNGGDGFVIASHLIHSEYEVSVVIVGDYNQGSDEFKLAFKLVPEYRVHHIVSSSDLESFKNILETHEIVIDAIFGNGLSREVSGIYYDVIDYINQTECTVYSIDFPSGINSNAGIEEGIAVWADKTFVIQHLKYGNVLHDALDHQGEVNVIDVGIKDNVGYSTYLLDSSILELLEPRLQNSHKYHYGNVLTIGGNNGMMGAPLLCGMSALKSGAGLSHVYYGDLMSSFINNPYPDLMVGVYGDLKQISYLLNKKDVVCFGVGAGRGVDIYAGILDILIRSKTPLVIDADGLDYYKKVYKKFRKRGNIIITPHVGEFSNLLGVKVEEVLRNGVQLAKDFALKNNVVVVLKGVTTIITDGTKVVFSSLGNPGMAKGGTGDVLTGIISAMVGNGYPLLEACLLGVYIHSEAGNLARDKYGERGMLASDLMNKIPYVIK